MVSCSEEDSFSDDMTFRENSVKDGTKSRRSLARLPPQSTVEPVFMIFTRQNYWVAQQS
jgi:hypothetical protein